MYLFISVLIVLAAIFLIFVVVIQNSKGGGLAAGFSSSNQVMGVRKTTDFLEKATWSLGGVIVVLCVVITFFAPSRSSNQGIKDSEIREEIQNYQTVDPNAVPFGNVAPESGQQQQQPTTTPPAEQQPAE